MTLRVTLVLLVLAWIATFAGVVWMMALAGVQPSQAGYLLVGMDIVVKICVALSLASAVFGWVRRRRARLAAGAAAGWGALGALYGAVSAQNVLICINPPYPLSMFAPLYAEALLALLIGLTGALVVLFRLQGARRV